jgi:hypothetical protein
LWGSDTHISADLTVAGFLTASHIVVVSDAFLSLFHCFLCSASLYGVRLEHTLKVSYLIPHTPKSDHVVARSSSL